MSDANQIKPGSQSNHSQTVVMCLLLAAGILALFWSVRSFDFLNYDDPDYVIDNPMVQSGLTARSVAWAFQTGHSSNWHPLTWISHMVDWELYGPNPAGHHFTNVILHALSAVLLFLFLRSATGACWRSFFVAAIFGCHPMHVESVAWVAERKDVLSGLFFFLTLWVFSCYARAESSLSRKRRYTAAVLLFACGLLSKPMLVTLPFVLLLLDFWPLRRVQLSFEGRVVEKIPFFALSFASCVVTFLVQQHGGSVATVQSLSILNRVANAVVCYSLYVGKTFWPDALSPLYPRPDWPLWLVVGSALILMIVTVAALRLRRFPYVIAGWFWFLGMLVPVIGLVQVGIQSMADRYNYLPMVGLLVAVAWGACDWLSRWEGGKKILPVAGWLAISACAVLTFEQLPVWKNSITLYERVLKVAHADPLFRQAIQTVGVYADLWNNYGHACADAGDTQQAIAHYEEGLRLNPKHVELHDNFGNALGQIGRPDLAVSHFELALQENPNNATVHNDYGVALGMMGKTDQAMQHLENAVRLNPQFASAHANLGNAYAMQGKLELAVREFLEALRLKPYEGHVHLNLGTALRELRQFEKALEHFQVALQLRPNDVRAQFNMGLTLAALGRREAAVAHFRETLRLDPNFAPAQQQLGQLMQQ